MRRCLVVDDSNIVRKVATCLLEKLGFKALEAQDGAQALQCCAEAQPDAILLDWHLPGMSAFEILAALRALPAGREPLVIYCTTENDPDDIARALATGADDYLLKPFNRAMIAEKLAGLGLAA